MIPLFAGRAYVCGGDGVREAMAIIGWIAAAVLAFLFAATAEPLVKEIPYVGDYLRDSCELSIIAAFAAVFAIALVLVSLFTPLFASVVQRSALGGLDRGLGRSEPYRRVGVHLHRGTTH